MYVYEFQNPETRIQSEVPDCMKFDYDTHWLDESNMNNDF